MKAKFMGMKRREKDDDFKFGKDRRLAVMTG
jgi:hypothetical protein